MQSQDQDDGGSLARWGGTVSATLFPPVCPVCRAETGSAHRLCPDCWREAHFLAGPGCQTCGRPFAGLSGADTGFRCDDCLRHPRRWRAGRAALAYTGTGRRLVLALKHGDRLDMLPMLAGWLARTGRDLIAESDFVVPVPIHWTRLLRRRANQSAELARALCRTASRPEAYAPDLLQRTRRTPSQDGKSRDQRAANIAGAIAVPRRRAGALAGRRVLIVDDVMTTGATLDAAAGALLEAGAAGVNVLVMALVLTGETAYLGADTAYDAKADEDDEDRPR